MIKSVRTHTIRYVDRTEQVEVTMTKNDATGFVLVEFSLKKVEFKFDEDRQGEENTFYFRIHFNELVSQLRELKHSLRKD